MDDFFGKVLIIVALFYLAIHVVVDFDFLKGILFLQ
jgi:hypothetical protein